MNQRARLQWYRWEGVYTVDVTLAGVAQRVQAVSDLLRAQQRSCLVACDTRFMGAQFARYAYQMLDMAGVRVGLCPTPASVPMVELAIERRRFESALMLSAGNRPYWYAGIHALLPAADAEPFAALPAPPDPAPPFPPELSPLPEHAHADLRGPYLELLREVADMDLIRRSTLTVFVDPMNGPASGLFPALLGEGAQTRAVEINREADPLFNRQIPAPAETGFPRLRKLVKESDSHMGVAISADGRALGVTDNSGEVATPLELALLLAQHLARHHRLRGHVVVPFQPDMPAGIAAWESATGLKVEPSGQPAARVAELVAQDRTALLVGVTELGEPTLGRYSGSADAAMAALLLTEMIAVNGGKLRAQLDDLRARIQQP